MAGHGSFDGIIAALSGLNPDWQFDALSCETPLQPDDVLSAESADSFRLPVTRAPEQGATSDTADTSRASSRLSRKRRIEALDLAPLELNREDHSEIIADLQGTIDFLRTQLTHVSERNEELTVEFDQKSQTLQESNERLKQWATKLYCENKQLRLTSMLDDKDVLTSKFIELWMSLEQWCQEALRVAPRPLQQNEMFIEICKALHLDSAHSELLLESCMAKLTKAYLSRCLCEAVFASGPTDFDAVKDLWLPEAAAQAVSVLEKAISASDMSFFSKNKWRTATVTGLSQYKARNNSRENMLTKGLYSVVNDLYFTSVQNPEEIGLERSLATRVVEKAVDLSCLIRRQDSCLYVRFPEIPSLSNTTRFVHDPYNLVESTRNPYIVDITLSPALYEHNSATGFDEEEDPVILKAESWTTALVI